MGKVIDIKFKYRFRTEEEFYDMYGEDWMDLVQYGWCDEMNYLCNETYPFENKDILSNIDNLPEYDGYAISYDMITPRNEVPEYKPRKLLNIIR